MTCLHVSYADDHKTASCMNSHTKFTQPWHQVSELEAINGTKSRPKQRPKSQPKLRPESGPSWDHVGTKSGPSRDQVIFKSPTQLHKISSSQNGIKPVSIQVTEQVSTTNHREHRGHRDLASEILNLQNHHKPCDELVTQQTIDTIRYPVGSELNTGFNPRLVTLHDMKEGNYDE